MTCDRICCDGQCSHGRACPLTANLRTPASRQRLAPGVIEGPFRSQAGFRAKVAQALATLLLRSRRST